MLAKDAIGKQAAEQRGQIDEPGVKPVDVRRQRLGRERAEQGFEPDFQLREPDHILGVIRQEDMFDHIENKQRAHSIVGETLPHLRGEQKRECARVAENISAGRPAGFAMFDR